MQTWPWREVAGSGVSREAEIVLQTLDMLVPDGQGSYLAAPISTGRRYYDALALAGATTYFELLTAIGFEQYLRTVRWPNVADGEGIAAELRRQGVPHVINTGPLMLSGWQGRDYMQLCFALIEKKVGRVYFHPEWAFSSGAAEEFVFCHKRGLPCLRVDGQALPVEEAIETVAAVCRYLQDRSLPAESYEWRLQELEALVSKPLAEI
jgi:hypothetical protein